MQIDKVVHLQPEQLEVASNVRFGLKPYRVQSLMNSIQELGGVQTPLKVEKVGTKYVVREGHYRHAAVAKLNESGAGLTLPCIIAEPASTELDRIRLQLSENSDRENLSPMDAAVTVKRLLDSGVARKDIRDLFKRPGGRKGIAMQPASNSWLNMMVSFLDFPKKIQNKIHDGTLAVSAAYELSKQPSEKWETILNRAEADRVAEIDAEEKADEKLAEDERKTLEAKAKQEQAEAELKAKLEETEKAEAALKEKVEAASVAYKALNSVPKTDKEAKKKAEEAFKVLEAERKAAEEASITAQRASTKLKEKLDAQAAKALERQKKLEEARKNAPKAPVTKEEVSKAAARESGGPVPLNATEMRAVIEGLTAPSSYVKVQKSAVSISKCFKGQITDGQLLAELAYIMGERKEKPKTFKEEKAAA